MWLLRFVILELESESKPSRVLIAGDFGQSEKSSVDTLGLSFACRANNEEYYQQLFLNTQRGCMSFRDIRTVGGTIYATYRDACFALGLLQDDREFMDAIKDASSWASGSYVRRLFVILLTSNNILRPEHVWDRCWHELSDDILYRQRAVMNMRELTMSDDEIKQLCLIDIDKILHSYVTLGRIFYGY
ncbi:hypothetical protein Ahy_B02g058503 [Arachis hypogaea]|uniref:Uncharacterized protein n=1 Tax=Arachis hypogaea TaxID=3818 RepID=A0A445AER5_ARAHY|nr:hypothetical protein Ahy_B02g058503 [Arachis hypogaea]